jgi:hypothetical protein
MSANRYQTCQQHEKHNKNVLGGQSHENVLAKTENNLKNKNKTPGFVCGYEQILLAAHCARIPTVDSSSECD